MKTLLLEPLEHRPFDLAFGVPRFTLWRRGSRVWVSVEDAHADHVRRELALHGVRATLQPDTRPESPPLVRAVGVGLDPARLSGDDLDLIEVRVLTLAEATADVLRRPIRHWPLGQGRRARCRALLRGTDAVFEIRRTAWCGRATLRSARKALRPVLFDPAATPRPIRVHASEHALTRWVAA
jgi:hypothetical protein